MERIKDIVALEARQLKICRHVQHERFFPQFFISFKAISTASSIQSHDKCRSEAHENQESLSILHCALEKI